MDASTKQTLVQAIQLLKSGDKKSAVPLLANVLKTEPSLVQAWYLLGLAVDSETQKIKAFQQALKLDPGHEKARNALAKLETPPPAPEIIPEPEPAPISPAEVEPAPPIYEETVQQEDLHSTEPLDASQVEIREEPFTEEPKPFEESSFEETSYDDESPAPAEEAPEMDLRAELSAEPAYPVEEEPAVETPSDAVEEPAASDEFALPDWMSESTFDPSDYQDEQPAEDIYQNTESEIPEWARMNPLGTQGTQIDPEPESEPEPEPEMPAWASMIPPEEDTLPEEEQDDDLPSWAASDDYSIMEEETPHRYPTDDSTVDRVSAFFEEEDAKEEAEAEADTEEEAPEEPDWLSGMVEDEKDGKKKRRRKELTPSQKKKRRKIILRILLAVIILGGAAAGYIFRDDLQPYWAKVKPYTDKVVNPVKTFAAPVTDLMTQGAPLTYLLTPDYNVTPTVTNTPPAQPTAEPTWTPQATGVPSTPTLRPTLGPDETPTVTPTTSPLPSVIESQIEELETQIEIMRGLTGPAELSREFLVESKLRQDMENQLIDAERLADFEDEQIILTVFGFIRGDVNLADPLLNTYADSIGGFYSPEGEKIYLLGSQVDGFGDAEKYIYALEYAHALQDNNFNLSNIGYYPKCKQSIQVCQAMNALVKGEAKLVNQLWLEQDPLENMSAIADLGASPTLFGPEEPAPFFTKDATFGTVYGLAFVEYLYDNGGWSAVNRAFNILPSTTEQILHPEKYQQREEAGGIAYPNYTSLLGQEWELIREESLGEWYTYLLLGYNDFPTAQRPDNEAALSAEGWSVDRYQVFYNPEEQQTFLSVYWIMESQEDGNQFYQSLEASLDARFGGAGEELPEGGKCWIFGGEKSCIEQKGQKVYWLLSENSEMVDLVRERFSVFP